LLTKCFNNDIWLNINEETAHDRVINCTKNKELKKNWEITTQIKMQVGKTS